MDLLETYGDFAVDSPQICGEKISVDPAQGYTRSVKSNHTLRVCFDSAAAMRSICGRNHAPQAAAHGRTRLPTSPPNSCVRRPPPGGRGPGRIPTASPPQCRNIPLTLNLCHSLLTTTSMFFLHFAKIF